MKIVGNLHYNYMAMVMTTRAMTKGSLVYTTVHISQYAVVIILTDKPQPLGSLLVLSSNQNFNIVDYKPCDSRQWIIEAQVHNLYTQYQACKFR